MSCKNLTYAGSVRATIATFPLYRTLRNMASLEYTRRDRVFARILVTGSGRPGASRGHKASSVRSGLTCTASSKRHGDPSARHRLCKAKKHDRTRGVAVKRAEHKPRCSPECSFERQLSPASRPTQPRPIRRNIGCTYDPLETRKRRHCASGVFARPLDSLASTVRTRWCETRPGRSGVLARWERSRGVTVSHSRVVTGPCSVCAKGIKGRRGRLSILIPLSSSRLLFLFSICHLHHLSHAPHFPHTASSSPPAALHFDTEGKL